MSRLGTMVLVLFVISLALFGLSRAAPGGPLGSLIPPDQVEHAEALRERLIAEYGLDQPLPVQYWEWVRRLLVGDMGGSFQFNRPVVGLMAERLVPTIELMGFGMLFGTLIAIALGIFQARRKGTFTDYSLGATSLVFSNTPGFFLGMILIYVFAARLQWFPSSQMSTPGDGSLPDLLRHLVLPVLTLTMLSAAGTMRYVRAGMLEELGKDYVRTAIAQGATERQAAGKAFRNSLVPIVTIVMIQVPQLLGGAVVLEAVFSWPGMGTLMIDAINYKDYPVMLGFGMTVSLIVVVNNFVTDLLVASLDPRVRLQ